MYAKNNYGSSNLQRYKAVKIQTASPAQIMIMLYDGAIRFSLQAKKKIEEKDYEAKGVFISKTQAIIDELMNSLDFTIAPELCTNLQQLYIYINERLTHANINLEASSMDEVIQLLNTLRDGWKQALASEADPTVTKISEGDS